MGPACARLGLAYVRLDVTISSPLLSDDEIRASGALLPLGLQHDPPGTRGRRPYGRDPLAESHGSRESRFRSR